MLPERSNTIRASGCVDETKRASSPDTGAVAFPVPAKSIKRAIPDIREMNLRGFIEPP
jgi:hypothetical protein